MWYAINKHKMMLISYELVSGYLFEAVNEPIIILGEDFFVKNCNEAALNITGYNNKDLKENSLDAIINFRNFNIKTIMQAKNVINIEVDLYRKKLLEDVSILLDNKTEKFAILFMDLDKFKSANDNYGHEAGDNILKTVAVRLKSIIRSTDEVYRIGGDEFIIILRNLKTSADAEKIAVDASESLSTAFTYKGNQLFVGACIGISLFPEHGVDADTLIKRADSAMYEVKRKGGNGYKIYSSVNENDYYI